MTITLKSGTSETQVTALNKMLEDEGLQGRLITGEGDQIVAIIGNELRHRSFLQNLEGLPFVREVNLVTSPYKPISRDAHPEMNKKDSYGGWISTEVDVGPVKIGGNNQLEIAAGPCSIDADNPTLLDEMVHQLYEMGVRILRGGGHKPRSDPYTFRGHERRALELGRQVADRYHMAFVTEPVRSEHIDEVVELADVLQIGTRNATQGFYLDVVAKTAASQMPILAKRGKKDSIEKTYLPMILNMYDNAQGESNTNIMLCLRGIETGIDTTRFTCDSGDVEAVREKNILPVWGDPSHSGGLSRYVVTHARQYIDGGVHALLVEVYPEGRKSLSDASQAITMAQLGDIMGYAQQQGRR
tara:strand:- start:185 stop:1255 length:1071 start_codon:yes stop_codon:yes gene_type:complete